MKKSEAQSRDTQIIQLIRVPEPEPFTGNNPEGSRISLSGPCSLGVAEVRTSHPRRGEAGPGSAPGALAKQS